VVVSAMVGPRTHATATLASNGPERTADETGALAPLRDWDWDKPTLESGTRDTYVTLRWWIGPSWSGTLGTSGWLSASALNSVQKAAYLEAREACTPSLHRTHNQIPSSQFMLLWRCESGCNQRSRLSTGGHFILDSRPGLP
jgi:hypothetical protein